MHRFKHQCALYKPLQLLDQLCDACIAQVILDIHLEKIKSFHIKMIDKRVNIKWIRGIAFYKEFIYLELYSIIGAISRGNIIESEGIFAYFIRLVSNRFYVATDKTYI